jgi:hypothetical protein
MTALTASAQVQIDKQVQMTGAAANDRRITNVSNAADVTPVGTDAININTVQRNYVNYSAGTFGGGTYAVTLTPAPAAYAAGMRITFRATAANTGATNVNVNALGAIPLVKPNGSALAANEIIAGQIVEAVYDGTSGHFEMVSPSSANSWMTLGNGGTSPTTNFLGTTDPIDLVIRTDNNERARMSATGNFGIGVTVPVRTLHIGGTYSTAVGVGSPAPTIQLPTMRINSLNAASTGTNNNSYPKYVMVDANGDFHMGKKQFETYYVAGTASRASVTSTALTLQPGMSQTITIPPGMTADVDIHATCGTLNVNLTASQFSTVDAVIHVNGTPLAAGGWNRITTVNHGTGNSIGQLSITTRTVLTAGTYTIDLRTARVSGNTPVTIGGNATTDTTAPEMTIYVFYR